MTKKKKKEFTQREREIVIIMTGIIMIFATALVASLVLPNKLTEDESRECHFKDDYWGFKTVCDVDIFGQEGNNNTVVSHYSHKRFNTCMMSLEFYLSHEKCQVLKEFTENKVAFKPR